MRFYFEEEERWSNLKDFVGAIKESDHKYMMEKLARLGLTIEDADPSDIIAFVLESMETRLPEGEGLIYVWDDIEYDDNFKIIRVKKN